MFSLISGYLNYYLQQPTFKFLIIGEEKSGKSVNKKNNFLNIKIDIFRAIKIYLHRKRNTIRLYFTNFRTQSYKIYINFIKIVTKFNVKKLFIFLLF